MNITFITLSWNKMALKKIESPLSRMINDVFHGKSTLLFYKETDRIHL